MTNPLERKKRENIAGYVIGMWHVEDLMRANHFDLEAVEAHLIAPMPGGPDTRTEMLDWYAGVIERMREQGIEETGHLEEVAEVMAELEFLHRSLLEALRDEDYTALWTEAEPGVTTLRARAGGKPAGPITTCFTAIYGVMLLRTRGQEVGAGTAEAETRMRRLLESLSGHYRGMRKLPGVSMN